MHEGVDSVEFRATSRWLFSLSPNTFAHLSTKFGASASNQSANYNKQTSGDHDEIKKQKPMRNPTMLLFVGTKPQLFADPSEQGREGRPPVRAPASL